MEQLLAAVGDPCAQDQRGNTYGADGGDPQGRRRIARCPLQPRITQRQQPDRGHVRGLFKCGELRQVLTCKPGTLGQQRRQPVPRSAQRRALAVMRSTSTLSTPA